MNLTETHDLLTFAAAVDNRRVDDATVATWQEILPDVDHADAREAVRRHFRDSREYLTPVHVAKGAETIHEERIRARVRAHLAAEEAEQRALTGPPVPTADRSDEVKALITSVVANLPQMDIHERAKARARKERGRPVPPPPATVRSKPRPIKYPEPYDDAIAALATRYLIDDYSPADVSARLGISRRWCERTAAKFSPSQP